LEALAAGFVGSISPRYQDYKSYLGAYKRVPFVRPCVSCIAYNAANVKYRLVRADADDAEDDDAGEMGSSPFLDLLARPNPTMTGFDLFELVWTHLELTGNAFIALEAQDAAGRPAELWPLSPENVLIVPDPRKGVARYEYAVNGAKVAYDAEEVWHARYVNPLDPYYGMGAIEAAEQRCDAAQAMVEHEANFWRNGAKITGVLETTQPVDDTIWQRVSGSIKQFFRGSGYSTLLLEAGLTYKSVSDGPAKLGLEQMALMSRNDILAMFGIPPTKVGILENANYKAMASDEFFWTETIDPKLTRMEQWLQPLVDRFHPGQGLAIRFERLNFSDDLVQAQVAEAMERTFALTINELRKYQGQDPVPHGDIILLAGRGVPVAFDPATGEATVLGGPATGEVAVDSTGQPLPPAVRPAPPTPLTMVKPPTPPAASPGAPTGGAVPATKAADSMRVPAHRPAIAYRVRRGKEDAADAAEASHAERLRTVFEQQEARVRAALLGYRARKADLSTDDLWDQAAEDAAMAGVVGPIHDDAAQAAFRAAADVGVRFDLHNPRLTEDYQSHVKDYVPKINETTVSAIDEQVKEGLRRGYSVRQIADGVDAEQYPGVRGVFAAAKKDRAVTISRTETGYAYNRASVSAYREGRVQRVEVADGESDGPCAAANGEVWTLDRAAAEPLQHPRCVRAFIPIVEGAA
jgi:HK97 family phage portal protein